MKTRHIRLAIVGLALAPFAGLALGGPPAAGAATGRMTRAPYVTDLSQTGAEVNFATSAGTAGSVLAMPESAGTCPASIGTWTSAATVATTRTPYGPGQGTTGWKFTVGTVSEYQNSVRLSGLSPATTYCYAVFADHTAGTPDLLSGPGYQHFTTLASPSAGSTAPVSFDVIGDTGENFAQTGTDGNGGAVSTPFSASVDPSGVENPYQSALYGEIGKDFATGHSQFLLGTGDTSYNGGTETTLGDLQQPGTVAQAQGLNATEYSNIFGPTYLPEAGGIPLYLADGNHGQNSNGLKAFPEQTTANSSGGTYAYDSYKGTDGVSGSFPDAWYAFSTGNVRIYVLDAAWTDVVPTGLSSYQVDADEHWQPSSPEMVWLKHDLANPSYNGMLKMAVFHFPIVSLNRTQPSDTYLQQDLEPVLAAGGVSIVFNGHAHTYQRIVPNAPGQLVSYVTGGGGGVPEPVDGNSDKIGLCAAEIKVANVYALGWDPTSALDQSPASAGSACSTSGAVAAPTDWGQAYSYLHVSVTGGEVQVEGVNADGQSFDPMTYHFTTGTPPPPPPPPSSPPPPSPPPATPPVSLPITASVLCSAHLPAGTVVGSTALRDGSGYYEVDRAGDVAAFGAATCYGAMTGLPLNRPIVGMASTPDGGGYWLVASDGGIFSFGDARFLGSTGALRLNQPIVGMASTPDGSGYWLVASDGGIFSFGDAPFLGSTGAMRLNRPVVGMAVDRATGGYWLVASDGGIFSFAAPFYGSTGNIHLNKPMVGMMAAPDGSGYWLVASDGGVFSGHLPFYGSTGYFRLNQPIVAGLADGATGGYWLTAADGGVFSFNAPFLGSAA